MRILLVLLLIPAASLGVAWLGGESWMASRATAVIEARDDLTAHAVDPLREPSRIGVHLIEAGYDGLVEGQPAGLKLPWLDLWVSPTTPYELRATLPDMVELVMNGALIALQMQGAGASLRFAPSNNMALSRASLQADAIELGGQSAISALSASAKLMGLGHDAPHAAGAAYDIALRLDQADPAVLAQLGLQPLALPGLLSADGGLRLWLDAAPGRGVFQGRAARPQPVGFRSTGLNLTLGDLSAHLLGEITADDQGRATGRLALYTKDSQGWLKAAADAGLIPGSGILLGGAMLKSLSATPMQSETVSQTDGHSATARAVSSRADFIFPDPAEGELRLPIFLRDGQIFLGAIPIGPAPQFPRS